MMKIWMVLCLLIVGVASLSGQASKFRPIRVSAPTFYLALSADTCQENEIRVSGATNLPPSAVVGVTVIDFNGDASEEYSPETLSTVDRRGLFNLRIHPKPGMKFRRNLLVEATFGPSRDWQPPDVLTVIGPKGQYLAAILDNPQFKEWDGYVEMALENPQAGQWSGWQYYLSALARVPFCGEAHPAK